MGLVMSLLLAIIFFYLPSEKSLVEAKIEGFTVELIHRHSPLSPFYNHSANPEELSRNDALRSIARANHFQASSVDENKIGTIIFPNTGIADYLMKISIGTPSLEVLAVADTGSDLVWIQCQPCDCFPQDNPPFNPKSSSTYRELSCDTQACQLLTEASCRSTSNECEYSYGYGDHSYTNGVLATETLILYSQDDQVATFPNSVFGCGLDNHGTFSGRETGLVGLGGGPLSLISQLGNQIERKFSYCLQPPNVNSASKMKFGRDAVLSGAGVVSTPLVSKGTGTYYYLNLQGVSVGNKRISNNNRINGNIIIDSGTTLTMLEPSLYQNLEAAVREAVGSNLVPTQRGHYRLCYDGNSLENVPEVTTVFHFAGADVKLQPLNIFRVFNSTLCLAMLPTDDLNIYGNVAQINFQVEYDLARMQVSFAPADCTQT